MLTLDEGYAEKITFLSRFNTKYLYVGRQLWGDGIFSDYPSISVSLSTIDILEFGDNIIEMLPIYHYNYWNGTYKGTFHTLILGKNITEMQSLSSNTALKKIICRMQNPIGFDNDFFSTQQYMNVEVYIPSGTQQKYIDAEGWKNFFIFVEDKTLSINHVINNEKQYNIWSLGGIKIKNSGNKSSNLKNSIYIINGRKIFVR